MANEKYVNYYIEYLTSTMTDCVIRNISMQANAKISDDVIQEQSKKVENLLSLIDDKQKEIDSLKSNRTVNENNAIADLNNKVNQKDTEITRLSNEINELRNKFRDYDSVKNQATHVETFKNELIKAREETNRLRDEYEKRIVAIQAENNGKIDILIKKNDEDKESLKKQVIELNAKIDYLQLPPSKRKKVDELNKEVVAPAVNNVIEAGGIVEDGGTF